MNYADNQRIFEYDFIKEKYMSGKPNSKKYISNIKNSAF